MKKTALITGASRGIGKAIAEKFAEEGYDLYLICQNSQQELFALKKQLEHAFGYHCTCFIGDIGSYEFVQECFSKIEALDVLVNNAGLAYIGLLSEMSPEEWNRILSVNLSAAFYTGKFAIPHMLKKQAGKIINISSVWGSAGASMEVAYSAAKGGLNAFTKALAKELALSNIQVNAIACGVIDTDMNRCLSSADMEALITEIPVDRPGTAEEVAELVLQLTKSPAYLTGQVIHLDGGWQ